VALHDHPSRPAAGNPPKHPTWILVLLGAVMVLAGLAVLLDVAFASIVSAVFIGAAAIVVGAFEIIHAAWTRGWGGLGWQMLLGLLYIALGLVLVGGAGSSVMVLTYVTVRWSGSGSLLLTYGLGLLLVLSGIVRILLAFRHWLEIGRIMLSSGAFGVLAGLVVLAEFPKMGFRVFGLLLGIDLISHGMAWLGYALRLRARAA
jgi:uncharacterized membrane protein HdeD (DUF308 family)